MAVLPSGLVIPPLPYLVVLVVLTGAVAAFLVSLEPRVDQRIVFGFVPWMAVGASAHVLYQIDPLTDVLPSVVEPLAAAPAVYVSTFIAMGAVWTVLAFVGSLNPDDSRVALYLGIAGTVALLGLLVFAATRGAFEGAKPYWSAIGLLVSIVLSVVVYFGVAYFATGAVARARLVGGLAVFAHVLDGVTTTVGIDILGRGERSPLPAAIMDFAGQLPTAPYIGSGWLFVAVKLAVVIGIVVVFADYLEEDPVRGNLLFAFVVAFGLGPAVNNLLLFALRDAGTAAALA